MSVLGQLDPNKSEIHIYGAGFSGLVLGYYLKKTGHKIKIFEKNERAGGLLRSLPTHEGLVETAANALLANDHVLELINELKLNYVKSPSGLKRWIVRTDRAQSFPLSTKELIHLARKLPTQVPFSAEEISQITVFDFFRPLLGEKVCDQVLTPALGGIYALTSRELHLLSLFKVAPEVLAKKNYWSALRLLMHSRKSPKEHSKGLGSISFARGMGQIIEALQGALKEEIHLGSVPPFSPLANTILCTGATSAAQLLKDQGNQTKSPLVELLQEIPYSPITTTTFFTFKPLLPLENSFGVLFSRHSGHKYLGLLNNRAIFPGRVTEDNIWSYTAIGASEALGDQQTKNKTEILQEDIRQFAGISLDPILLSVHPTFWPQGIPCYNPKRYAIEQKLKAQLLKTEHQGLLLFGNYTGSLSLREILGRAREFSRAN